MTSDRQDIQAVLCFMLSVLCFTLCCVSTVEDELAALKSGMRAPAAALPEGRPVRVSAEC